MTISFINWSPKIRRGSSKPIPNILDITTYQIRLILLAIAHIGRRDTNYNQYLNCFIHQLISGPIIDLQQIYTRKIIIFNKTFPSSKSGKHSLGEGKFTVLRNLSSSLSVPCNVLVKAGLFFLSPFSCALEPKDVKRCIKCRKRPYSLGIYHIDRLSCNAWRLKIVGYFSQI